jgi:hypothetical protein
MCYIQGGQPSGSKNKYDGCKNKTQPVSEAVITLNHELYFAEESKSWQGGGVGFVKIKADPSSNTLGYMYLITKEQFCDVVKQEIKSKTDISLDFDAAIQKGNDVFKQDSWYGNLVYVGKRDELPIFTFTRAEDRTISNRPSPNYLSMIISGLVKTHGLSQPEIVEYLSTKQGIVGNYTNEQLNNLVQPLMAVN